MAKHGAAPDGPDGQRDAANGNESHGAASPKGAATSSTGGSHPWHGRERDPDSTADAGRCQPCHPQRPGLRRVELGGTHGSDGGATQTARARDRGAEPQLPRTGKSRPREDPVLLQPTGRDNPHQEAGAQHSPPVSSLIVVERPLQEVPLLPLASGRAAGHVADRDPKLS